MDFLRLPAACSATVNLVRLLNAIKLLHKIGIAVKQEVEVVGQVDVEKVEGEEAVANLKTKWLNLQLTSCNDKSKSNRVLFFGFELYNSKLIFINLRVGVFEFANAESMFRACC